MLLTDYLIQIMELKGYLQRFREWQRQPIRYTNKSTGPTTCQNCGTVFEDNFCPRCGQKAGVGRIGWKTVQQGVMMVWGMDSRSLGYSLIQLLLRPGYFISDYISGRRQVSFPPVKMLFLVAIAYILVEKLVEIIYPWAVEPDDSHHAIVAIDTFTKWGDKNPAWLMLVITGFILLPTWLVFRYAPRHARHSLPEEFYIQVFMSVQILLLSSILSLSLGWYSNDADIFFIPIYYIITYKQLFGYHWWGTIWRFAVCIIATAALFSLIIVILMYYEETIGLSELLNILPFFTSIGLLTVAVAFFISKRTAKKRTIHD